MRRILLGIGAAIVALALASTAGAHALWGEQRVLNAGVSTTGTFAVNAVWKTGAPVWPALFPNARTPDATIVVTQTGNGTTLGWRIRVSSTVSANFASSVTFQAWAGACGTGTPIPAGGYPATGHLAQGASVELCVRYTLANDAPSTLQNLPLNPQITVTGEQAGS